MSNPNGRLVLPKPLRQQGAELDDRLHAARGVRTLLRKIFPDHWSFLLGEVALYSFIILILTGIFLTLFFQPSMTEVVYHGSYTKLDGVRMSQAYASTLNISFDVRGGLLMRQIHHWAADIFLAAIFCHMLRLFFTGAYRKPRDTNWLIGIAMLTLGIIEGFLGYSMPDDLLSGTGVRIAEGVLLGIPVVGTYLSFFLFGGQFPGTEFVARFYIIHVLLVPGLLLALVSAHLFLMIHQKHTQMPGKGRTEGNVVGQPMYPYFMVKTGAFFFFVFGALALLATFAQINPIWQYGPYTPLAISAGSQPDFYMGWLEGSLRMFPSWTWDIAGHTVAWNVLVPALVVPGVLFTALGLWPQIERWATGDKGYHHVNDRPRNAPTRTAFGMAGVTFYGILWLEGANDLIAVHFNIDLYLTTEIARYAIFIGPVVAFWVTRRICLGLQRKDAQMLAHGVETGIIRQLPNGAFVEAERPVTEDEAAVLIARPPAPQLPAASAVDSNGIPVPEMRGLRGRVRSRVNAMFAEGISLAPPDGHGNGHGEGEERAEGEHVAVGAGSSGEPGPGGGGRPAAVEDESGTHGGGV
ncbi:MAG TPA: ubiquinol-cytochrome c reductase cytochrome b subunit [Streptosporangiaceae bacterium]|nr:ubiquinol-cytochrome c reductase cytochrome b subunit [Streptosporangiaceae bacterium]